MNNPGDISVANAGNSDGEKSKIITIITINLINTAPFKSNVAKCFTRQERKQRANKTFKRRWMWKNIRCRDTGSTRRLKRQK